MKKLMFSAAIAAMSAGAFAGVAQVYDMTITLKTTECKDNKKLITDKCGNSYRYYRNQTSYKFEGKFWGCGCGTIANPIADQYGMPRLDDVAIDDITCDINNNSYMFWGSKAAFHHVDFGWRFLQLIGKNSTNVEGVFDADFFVCKDGELQQEYTLNLTGAGYGKAYINECMVDEDDDGEYDGVFNRIESMNGSVVGVYNVDHGSGMVGCKYCGESKDCLPFPFCLACDETHDLYSPDESAAFGTFSLKYNSKNANSLAKGDWIDEAYKFKSFVTKEFDCIAAGEEPVEPTEQCKKLDQAVVAAEKEYANALEAADLVTDEALKLACETTKAAADDQRTNVCDKLNAAWNATNDVVNADIDATNVTVVAVKSAKYEVSYSVLGFEDWFSAGEFTGAESFKKNLVNVNAKLANAQTFTVKKDGDIVSGFNKITATTENMEKLAKYVDDILKAHADAVAKYTADKANLDGIKAEWDAAEEKFDGLVKKMQEAGQNWDSRKALQAAAAVVVSNAKNALDNAKIAYTAAGCE